MIQLLVAGAAGRMGTRIRALAQEAGDFNVVYGLESPNYKGGESGIGSDLKKLAETDVVIDFSLPEASLALAKEVLRHKKALVLGTTGFTPDQDKELAAIAKQIPVVKSPNMSVGVNVFFKLVEQAAKALPDYSVKIVEAHHQHKKDAPSGTALHAGALIEKVVGRKVTYESIREGEIVGDHRVIFSGPTDQMELFHHADSRDMFAQGALTAARWIAKQKPGLYSMRDVLGL